MQTHPLVGRLFDGPIDVIGDVHGEIDALRQLTGKLGYDEHGRHPEDRRLVFVGDLGDRGPDSPAVIRRVRDLAAQGRAQAVLGNHDLNALQAAHGGEMKTELSWLFDRAPLFKYHGHLVPQKHVGPGEREEILGFFRSLPVALERGGDLPVRVVHACWDNALVDRLRHRHDALAVYRQERQVLASTISLVGLTDSVIAKLLFQNCNAVKRLTSGLEGLSPQPIYVNDRPRHELRLPWWHDYHDDVLCVIGHYWRLSLPGEVKFESLFAGLPLNATHGGGPVMCIDFSAGKRFRERLQGGPGITRLAALRLPEKRLYFDNAEPMSLLTPR